MIAGDSDFISSIKKMNKPLPSANVMVAKPDTNACQHMKSTKTWIWEDMLTPNESASISFQIQVFVLFKRWHALVLGLAIITFVHARSLFIFLIEDRKSESSAITKMSFDLESTHACIIITARRLHAGQLYLWFSWQVLRKKKKNHISLMKWFE